MPVPFLISTMNRIGQETQGEFYALVRVVINLRERKMIERLIIFVHGGRALASRILLATDKI